MEDDENRRGNRDDKRGDRDDKRGSRDDNRRGDRDHGARGNRDTRGRQGGDRSGPRGDRGPRRDRDDRPRGGGDRGPRRDRDDRGPRRDRDDRPRRDFGDRNGRGPRGDRDDRPRRDFRDRDGDRGPRRDRDDRGPRRDFGDRNDRGPRGDRDDRPRRDFRGRDGDRGPRRDRDDRPRRDFGDRSDRGPRRDRDDRPRRDFGDRNDRGPRGDRDDRPRKDFRGRDNDRGPRQDGDRPRSSFEEREARRNGPRDDRSQGRGHFRKTDGRETGRREGDRPGGPRRPVEVSTRNAQRGGSSDGPHWIFGRHAVMAALANPAREIQRLIATDAMAEQAGVAEHALLEKLTRPDMDHMLSRYDAQAATHGGIAAYAAPLVPPSVEALLKPEGPAVCVLLDQVSDPHNVGAILRTAAAFGARAVIAPERNAAPVTGSMAKAASGALETVPYLRPTNLSRTLAMLKEWGYWRIGLDGGSDKPVEEAAGFERVALVLGSEGKGLRRLTGENCDLLVSIPMSEKVESLNVSNAAAIALYGLSQR